MLIKKMKGLIIYQFILKYKPYFCLINIFKYIFIIDGKILIEYIHRCWVIKSLWEIVDLNDSFLISSIENKIKYILNKK